MTGEVVVKFTKMSAKEFKWPRVLPEECPAGVPEPSLLPFNVSPDCSRSSAHPLYFNSTVLQPRMSRKQCVNRVAEVDGFHFPSLSSVHAHDPIDNMCITPEDMKNVRGFSYDQLKRSGETVVFRLWTTSTGVTL